MALLVPLAELDDDELLFVKDFQARISDATSSNYKKSIECPLWVKSRHFTTTLRMSAFGSKADINLLSLWELDNPVFLN